MCKSKDSFIDHQLEVAAEVARKARPNHYETLAYMRGVVKEVSLEDRQISCVTRIHGVLMVIKKCKEKQRRIKRLLANWSPDLSLYHKEDLEFALSWQLHVLRRLTAYHAKHMQRLIEPFVAELDIDNLFTDKKPAA